MKHFGWMWCLVPLVLWLTWAALIAMGVSGSATAVLAAFSFVATVIAFVLVAFFYIAHGED